MIKVVNIRNYKGKMVYIGRGSVVGNKFIIGKNGDRKEVIKKYEIDLMNEDRNSERWKFIEILKSRHVKGENIVLGCYCSPLACHGDIIKKIIENDVK
jgi:hypothetical protein